MIKIYCMKNYFPNKKKKVFKTIDCGFIPVWKGITDACHFFILFMLQKKTLVFIVSFEKKLTILSLNIAFTVFLSHSLIFKVLHLPYAFFGIYPTLFLIVIFSKFIHLHFFVNRLLSMFHLIYFHPRWCIPPLLHIFWDVLNSFVLSLDVLILV